MAAACTLAPSAHDAAATRRAAWAMGAKSVARVMRPSLRANRGSVKTTFSADATPWRRRCAATRAAAGATTTANGRPRARAARRHGGSAAWKRAAWAQSGRGPRERQDGRRLSAMARDQARRSRAGAGRGRPRAGACVTYQGAYVTRGDARVTGARVHHARGPAWRGRRRVPASARRLRRVPAPSPARWRARRPAWRRRCRRPWPCPACRRPCRRPAAPRS